MVNAVELVLQSDAKSQTPSIFLVDPYPEYMVDALIRTAHSLLFLLKQEMLKEHVLSSLTRPITKGLEILAEISYLAAEAVPLIRARYSEMGVDDPSAEPKAASRTCESVVGFHDDPSEHNERLLRVLEHRSVTDTYFVNNPVERMKTDTLITSLLEGDLGFLPARALSMGWNFHVSISTYKPRDSLTWNTELFC